jgi:dienelactone hydrolase
MGEGGATWTRQVAVPVWETSLAGDLTLPPRAASVVVFVEGGAPGRTSPAGRHIAGALHEAGIGSLLLDLLDDHEARRAAEPGAAPLDLDLVAGRAVGAVDWLATVPRTRDLAVGLFGAGEGAAAALAAAAERAERIGAVVCSGGRAERAEDMLPHVSAPTLLIAGESDPGAVAGDEEAAAALAGRAALAVVPGVLEESHALERVAQLAADWFARPLAGAGD